MDCSLVVGVSCGGGSLSLVLSSECVARVGVLLLDEDSGVHWAGKWWQRQTGLVECGQSNIYAHLHTNHLSHTSWCTFLVGLSWLWHCHLMSIHEKLSPEKKSNNVKAITEDITV